MRSENNIKTKCIITRVITYNTYLISLAKNEWSVLNISYLIGKRHILKVKEIFIKWLDGEEEGILTDISVS